MSISSTWASSKFALATAAVSCAAALCLAWFLLLVPLSRWAELHLDSYPYKGGEDALRYILPTIHGQQGRGRLLLMGSSNAGEGMLYEMFDRDLPGLRATHGAISMNRLTEIKVLLEYIEQVYGREALPEVVVLGASTRLISNVPWDEPSRAFHAIDSYSAAFRVETSPEDGSRRVRKTAPDGLLSPLLLSTKQLPRFRAAMGLALLEVMGRRDSYLDFSDRREVRALTYAIGTSSRAAPFPEEFVRAGAFIMETGPLNAVARYLRFRFSPYLAHIHPPASRDSVRKLASSMHMWWKDVRTWKPAADDLARRELKELAAFARERGIELYVINLPEHPDVVAVYEGDLREEYLAMLEQSFGDHFLDLGDYLPAEQFNDSEHPGYEGALRVSKRVIEFIASRRKGLN